MATTRGWLAITKDMVHRRLTAAEISRLQTVQKEPGEAIASDQGTAIALGPEALGIGAELEDPMAEQIQETVDEIRGAIATGKKNYALNDDVTTLPASLHGVCLSIIVVKLNSRIGGQLIDISEVRMKFYDEAQEALQRIRQGDQAIPEAEGGEFAEETWLVESTKKLDL